MDMELRACLFHKHRRDLSEYLADGGDQAGFGVMGGDIGDVLDVWPNKVVQWVQVGGGWGNERRVQSRSTPEAKPGSLWTCGPAPSPAATPRVWHLIAPGDHHTLQHIQVHFGVDFKADFEDVRGHDLALTWNHTKDLNRSRKLCFHHLLWGCWQWSCCHNLDR